VRYHVSMAFVRYFLLPTNSMMAETTSFEALVPVIEITTLPVSC